MNIRMNTSINLTKEFLSNTNEKEIFFYHLNKIHINSYKCNYDNVLKNYILNCNLYEFYNYFFCLIIEKTKYNINDVRTSLLKQRFLNRLKTRIYFFHNRMILSKQEFLNSKNNNILLCV